MGKLKLQNNVEESTQKLIDIEKMLTESYTSAKSLYDGIDAMAWEGESRNHFYAMLGIILQYHKALDDSTLAIQKAMEELYESIEMYDQYQAVKKIKEIE